jgi:hypothetical protein
VRPTSHEKVEAEGGVTLSGSLLKQGKMERGGSSGYAARRREAGSGKARRLWWCLGGRQLAEATEASDGPRTGARGGDPVGERRGGRVGQPGKDRNMGPSQRTTIRFDLFKNFSNDFELI